jgi:pimeloyl-ACP methyl ester carboxylesterase
VIRYRTVDVDGLKIFYREAGDAKAPTLLLLHGFPTSSHMFRDLIPLLADRHHLVAPDLPGFGFSDAPPRAQFKYTFDHLAQIVDQFTQTVRLRRYALYIFDYGAPIGFRLALTHPERITAIISQNGNAYEEGLSQGWNPIQKYWKEPTKSNRAALRDFLKPETTKLQYVHGVSDETLVAPESICFSTTPATSCCIQSFRNISALSNRHFSRSGARTIPSSCQPGQRRSNAMSLTLKFASWTPVTSLSRRTLAKSRLRLALFLESQRASKLTSR